MSKHLKLILWTSGCLAVFMAGLVSALAQKAPAPTLPTVDQILDKYVAALGGLAAIQKVTSRVAKGTFELEQMPGAATMEIYQKAPNKIFTQMVSSAIGTVKRGFDGEKGWQDSPQTGLADLTGSQLAELKRSADLYGEIHLKDLYPKMTVKGEENVGGRQAYVISAESNNGIASTMYFDADSGLEVRTVSEVQSPNGPVQVDTMIGDYRDVDGIKVPFSIHESVGQMAIAIKFTDIKQNVPIDDAKFEKPATE